MPKLSPIEIKAVLFDLDGTLADTAPDLGAALRRAQQEDGHPQTPLSALRPVTSQGVRGLIFAGYGWTPEHTGYTELADRVLAHYAANICVDTRLFPNVGALLAAIEQRDTPWGIITNKHTRFTTPLTAAMGLSSRAKSIVSGDTTAEAKPSALPMLHAAKECGVAPNHCLYLGDDRRDIQAAHAAGMIAAAVTWGYHPPEDPIDTWGADLIIDDPLKVLDWLDASA